jgi:hypothetical protein
VSCRLRYLVQGQLLRNNVVHNALIGAHWTTSLLFALVQRLVGCYDDAKDNFDGMKLFTLITLRSPEKAWVTVDAAAKVIETYNRFASRVEELGLQGDVDAKPILDVSPRRYCDVLWDKNPDITPTYRDTRSYGSSTRLNQASGRARCLVR